MKTLKDLIIDGKCRHGKAVATTKRGAYWLACEPILIRDFGGDGIGNSPPDCEHHLELRHYRDGTVSAVVHGSYWHQNGASADRYERVDGITTCTTIEQVIVVLKGVEVSAHDSAYSDRFEQGLTEHLTSLGLAERDPSPDDEQPRREPFSLV